MPTRDDRTQPVLVVCGPPTTNGDLHVGHVAGPYVASDVFVRHQRATGHDVVFASGGDDSQTYVVTRAKSLGVTPRELTTRSWELIKGTFEAIGVGLDGFAPTDDGYRETVYDYVNRLYEGGKLRKRTVRLPYGERSGEYLVEGLIGGDCPTCLADSRGGICESCGHPVDFDGLLDPSSILDPGEPITYRDVDILVFPLEEYRERLIRFYEAKATTWRPHAVALMRELLAGPLPDFAITYPVGWGLPAPFPETPGQTLNAWLEGMPASMYCTAHAQRELGLRPPSHDDAWRAEHDARLVFFVGFDNMFIWGLVHVAELMAHDGRYVLPDTILSNEFYELESEKFSTSKGHVLWARDLVADVDRDVARFYLSLSAPEHSRTNFSRESLLKVAGERLVQPWNELATAMAKLTAEVGGDGTRLPVGPRTPALAAAMVRRFGHCYELPTFSMTRAADLVVQNIARLRAQAERTLSSGLDRDALLVRVGDLFLQLRALTGCASPVLVDLAARTGRAGGFTPAMTASTFDVAHTTAFAVPSTALWANPNHDD